MFKMLGLTVIYEFLEFFIMNYKTPVYVTNTYLMTRYVLNHNFLEKQNQMKEAPDNLAIAVYEKSRVC